MLLRYRDDGNIGQRFGGGTSRRTIDERHFPEDALAAELVEQAVAGLDFYIATLDHVQLGCRIALAKDELPRLKRSSGDLRPYQNVKVRAPRLRTLADPSFYEVRQTQ